MIEVDAEQANSVLAQIKKHKLRAKLSVRLLEDGELEAWSVWREEEKWTPHSSSFGETFEGDARLLGLVDTRATGMGQRVLLPPGPKSKIALQDHPVLSGLAEAPLSAYNIRRYMRGVPEGQSEIPRDNTFPMNSNIDTMNGIDFKKGCYVGQELTIRTHHTGVVRRRILPVSLYETDKEPPEKLEYTPNAAFDPPAHDVDIKVVEKRGRPGKWIAGIGNIGLAMCRLEMMTDLAVTSEPSQFSPGARFVIPTERGGQQLEVGIKAFVPDWLRGKIRTPKTQRRIE